MDVTVRDETPGDRSAVRAINLLAFGGPGEADLVDALRERATPCVSLVAEAAGRVVGHLMLSPVTLDGHPALRAMGLAPMAVLPDHQGIGVGSALVRAGLEACRALGTEVVVVLGHPGYYPRFGFAPASRLGLRCVYDAPDEAFMALELTPGALVDRAGLLRFHPAFDELPESDASLRSNDAAFARLCICIDIGPWYSPSDGIPPGGDHGDSTAHTER